MESVESPLEVVLKGIISRANQLNKPAKLTWDRLSKILVKNGGSDLDFDSFEAEYNSNPQIQGLVTNYDQNEIELISNATDAENVDVDTAPQSDEVGKMAKRATDRAIG